MFSVIPNIELITLTRENLFSLTRYLAYSFPREFLMDPKNPTTVFMDGTQNAGKSIFPDATAEYMLAGETTKTQSHYDLGSLSDKRQINESHTREIAFVNLFDEDFSFGGNFSDDAATIKAFQAQRRSGGVYFFANGFSNYSFSKNRIIFDLNLWILSSDATIEEINFKKPKFSNFFNQFAADEKVRGNSWVRYVAVSVESERLRQSRQFMNAMRVLSPRDPSKPPIVGENVIIPDVPAYAP